VKIQRAVFVPTGSRFIDALGLPAKPVYPKRAIWRELLKMAWERGEYTWSGRLLVLLRRVG
jgi:hypothetical protein